MKNGEIEENATIKLKSLRYNEWQTFELNYIYFYIKHLIFIFYFYISLLLFIYFYFANFDVHVEIFFESRKGLIHRIYIYQFNTLTVNVRYERQKKK